MSARGEVALVQHLFDVDSLRVLAEEGLHPDVIPTEIVRSMVAWALDYWHRSGRSAAPSIEAFRAIEVGHQSYGDSVDDLGIDIAVEADDTIEWVISDLRATWATKQVQDFAKDLVTKMAGAHTDDRVNVVDEFANRLVQVSMRLTDRSAATRIEDGIVDRLYEYERRAAAEESLGAHFGLDELDEYTHGIQPGELAVLAAPPKAGKSYLTAKIALAERQRGRKVALFTLENNIGMTIDRMACMAAGVDSSRWQRGECTPEELAAVFEWAAVIQADGQSLWVLQPDLGKRSMEQMVREAQIRGADTLIIDQLTFVELPSPKKARHERIGEALHSLKGMISTGRGRMPCFLAHQVNREGVKAADKAGHLEMYHMAESAEVERTADWVFGLYASPDEKIAQQLKFQTLAARRAVPRHWQLNWQIGMGHISVRQPLEIHGS